MEKRIFLSGDTVVHFKRDFESAQALKNDGNLYLYEIVGEATDAGTGERMMVYRALYGDGRMYVRSFEEFMSVTDSVKYPKARQHYRFELFSRQESK